MLGLRRWMIAGGTTWPGHGTVIYRDARRRRLPLAVLLQVGRCCIVFSQPVWNLLLAHIDTLEPAALLWSLTIVRCVRFKSSEHHQQGAPTRAWSFVGPRPWEILVFQLPLQSLPIPLQIDD